MLLRENVRVLPSQRNAGGWLSTTHLLSLVVLQNAAHSSGCRTERRVKTMNVFLLDISLHLGAKSYLKGARLIVGTVGARDEFFVFALEWEPGL